LMHQLGVELCEVSESDFELLSRFVTLIFGLETGLVRSLFEFWWRLNPFWNETIPRGWLVRSPNKEIIAFTANIPLPYVVAGRRGVSYATGTIGVHPDWRGKGISKLVARSFAEQKTPDLLVGCVLASLPRSAAMALNNCFMWPPTQVTNGCLRLRVPAFSLSAPSCRR